MTASDLERLDQWTQYQGAIPVAIIWAQRILRAGRAIGRAIGRRRDPRDAPRRDGLEPMETGKYQTRQVAPRRVQTVLDDLFETSSWQRTVERMRAQFPVRTGGGRGVGGPPRRVDWGRIRRIIDQPLPRPPTPLPEPAPVPRRSAPPPTSRPAPRTTTIPAPVGPSSFPGWLAMGLPIALYGLRRRSNTSGFTLADVIPSATPGPKQGPTVSVPTAQPAPSPFPSPQPAPLPGPQASAFASSDYCEQQAREKRKKRRKKCDQRFNVAWTSGPNKGKVAGSRCFKFQ